MGMEKVLFSGLLFVLAVGFIQAEDECKITELQTIDNCLKGFNTTTVSLVNKECTLNADMCRVAVNVGKCLNDATLGDTCRAFLPTYIHQQLRLAQLRCTLSQIAKQCPNSKVKTENECRDQEINKANVCLQVFPHVTINTPCALNNTMCKAVVTVADCLNGERLTDRCRAYLPTYIDQQLGLLQIRCTVDVIEKLCPNAKLKRGGENECRVQEINKANVCLQGFPHVTINTPCALNNTMCKAVVIVADCLNGERLTDKCRAYLPTYIDQQLGLLQIRCTVDVIEKQCPNAKLKRGGAPQQVMLSLMCLFVSLFVGFHFTT